MNKIQGLCVVTLLFVFILVVGYLIGGVHQLDNQERPVVETVYEHGLITGQVVGTRNVGYEPSISYFVVGLLLICGTMFALFVSMPPEDQ